MEAGFRIKACGRTKVSKELTKMKEEVRSMTLSGSCAVSSSANTGYGLGSGTYASPNVSKIGRNTGCKGWVKDWHIQ